MALIISNQQVKMIETLSEESYPNECCGFLLGRQSGTDKGVTVVLPATNEQIESEKYHRFLISPDAYLKSERYARENDLDVLGFYHSHPEAPARPSEFDREHAWPWYSYIIVSVRTGRAAAVTSWVLADDRKRFHEEKIAPSNDSPEEQSIDSLDLAR